jgi:hypothetical protein
MAQSRLKSAPVRQRRQENDHTRHLICVRLRSKSKPRLLGQAMGLRAQPMLQSRATRRRTVVLRKRLLQLRQARALRRPRVQPLHLRPHRAAPVRGRAVGLVVPPSHRRVGHLVQARVVPASAAFSRLSLRQSLVVS